MNRDWLDVHHALTRLAAVVVPTTAAARSEHAAKATGEVVATAREANGDAHTGISATVLASRFFLFCGMAHRRPDRNQGS